MKVASTQARRGARARAIIGAPLASVTLVALGILILLGFQHLKLPAPVAADAPPSVFAAERAQRSVERIARSPHPSGTVENAKLRSDLLASLTALGLETEVQSGFSVAADQHAVGMVHNIVARMPGRKPGKSLLLMAHYDSVPHSPGAADDGTALAAILETLRAVKSGPELQNDLVCVFTDGEEIGLLGARLFMQRHRFAKQVGMAINFDFRGNSGPVWMFETGPANGAVIAGFASAVARPLGNSLLNDLYKVMPNDTDLTILKLAGVPALNFAAGERYTSYHTELDRADLLNQGTLQHTGDIMLALTRHFGNAELDNLSAPDSIYADVPFAGMVHYSPRALLPLLLLAAFLTVAALVAGRRTQALRLSRTMAAIPIFSLVAALVAGLCQLLWKLLKLVYPDYQLMLHGTTYNAQWYLLFFAALSVGTFVVVQRLLVRSFLPAEWGMAAACVWLMGLATVSMLLPGASFFLTWPLLSMLVAFNVLFGARLQAGSDVPRLLILVAGAAPGLLLIPPLVELVYVALTPALVVVPILVLMLLLGLLTPLLARVFTMLPVRLAPWLLSVLFMLAAARGAGFDAAHPRPDNLSYVQPQDGAPALWASTDAQLDRWTRPLFASEKERRNESAVFGQFASLRWLATAPPLGIAVPRIEVGADRVKDNKRLLTLMVRSSRLAPRLDVTVEGARVLHALIAGQPYRRAGDGHWRVDAFGMQDQPLRIELELVPDQALRVWARDFSYGLTSTGLPARPPDMLIQPFRDSDTIQAVASVLIPEMAGQGELTGF
jgi:hypothetical protein